MNEIKHNLRIVGQFDLADALGSTPVNDPRIIEYTRYLIALNGCRSHYAQRTRADTIAALWSYVDGYSDAENLRVIIFIHVERLVRECSDIKSIHDQLEALAAAYAASFNRSSDLQKLASLVSRGDFGGLRRLPPPDTMSKVDIFGRAYHYHEYGNMDGIASDEALGRAGLEVPCQSSGSAGEPPRGPAGSEHS